MGWAERPLALSGIDRCTADRMDRHTADSTVGHTAAGPPLRILRVVRPLRLYGWLYAQKYSTIGGRKRTVWWYICTAILAAVQNLIRLRVLPCELSGASALPLLGYLYVLKESTVAPRNRLRLYACTPVRMYSNTAKGTQRHTASCVNVTHSLDRPATVAVRLGVCTAIQTCPVQTEGYSG